MKYSTIAAVLSLSVINAFAAEPVIPGEFTDPTAVRQKIQDLSGYKTPEHLKFPYISSYYVKPVVKTGEKIKLGYYVTDFEQSEIRFKDDSFRFTVFLEIKGGKTYTQKEVKAGDHAFTLAPLPKGEYEFAIRAVDNQGRESHRVWQFFKVVEPADLEIPADKVYTMTAADLAKYNICNTGAYGRKVCVEVSDPKNKDKIAAELDAYLAANDVKRKDKVPGYTIVVPCKDGKPIYFSGPNSRLIYDEGYNAEKVEREAARNAAGLQKLIDEKASEGFRKFVMLPGYYRISWTKTITMPDNFTLDLNSATLKTNPFAGDGNILVTFASAIDAKLVNGTLEGDYYEHDYKHSPNNSEWPKGFEIGGDSRYCTVEKVKVVDITGYGAGNGIMKDRRGDTFSVYDGDVGKFASGGLNRKTGEVEAADTARFTTDFKSLAKFDKFRRLQISRYLGYQGWATKACAVTVGWYDAEKKFLSAETVWQYREIPIPDGAKFMRVSVEADSAKAAEDAGLKVVLFRWPKNCVVRDCLFERCRCVGYAPCAMSNFLFYNNEFTQSGESAAKCAFDAEDGWDQMQDTTFINNYFHDNPINNSILTCAGHNFILMNNRCDVHFWARTHSPVLRNNVGADFCVYYEGHTRSGYPRISGNEVSRIFRLFGNGADGWYATPQDLETMCGKNPMTLDFGGSAPIVGGSYTNIRLNAVCVTGATFDNCKSEFVKGGVWTGSIIGNSEFVNVYQTNEWNRCEFIGTKFRNVARGKQIFRDCNFKKSIFDWFHGADVEFLNCSFEDTPMPKQDEKQPNKIIVK